MGCSECTDSSVQEYSKGVLFIYLFIFFNMRTHKLDCSNIGCASSLVNYVGWQQISAVQILL